MIFNSYQFIFFFLPITLIGYYFLARFNPNYSVLWIGICSLVFYGGLSTDSIPILCISILMNYSFGIILIRKKKNGGKNYILPIAIFFNLIFLIIFKYLNFIISNANYLFRLIDHSEMNSPGLLFPIGISFFTFTQIAYLIDCNRGDVIKTSFWDYLVFVTYFPHLLAGPIIHHKQIIGQLSEPKTYKINDEKFTLGFCLFVLGLSKKILLADTLSSFSDPIYSAIKNGSHIDFLSAWVGAISYTFQLYFDFSGYSDMAVGISLMFGIIIPINFNSPLKANSIIEFWQKWHMTLTKYFGQYLYTPLTLSATRKSFGKGRVQVAISTLIYPTLLTFCLIGLWHGASWNFVIFGLMHALYIIINNLWRDLGASRWMSQHFYSKNLSRIYWIATFTAILLAFVMFRTDSVSSAVRMYKAMFFLSDTSLDALVTFKYLMIGIFVIISFLIILYLPSTAKLTDSASHGVAKLVVANRWVGFSIGVLFILCLLSMNKSAPFLYFEF